MKKIICLILFLFLTGCASIPKDLKAVDGFDIKRYVGTWYEIARFENKFEKGLTNVFATYTLRKDGGIDILHMGFDMKTKKWKSARGKAFFVSNPENGRLKVSFSGPFYSGYNIIALDKEQYSYVLVCGNDKSYFWILSRNRIMSLDQTNKVINIARDLGFDIGELTIVDQDVIFKMDYLK